MFLRLLLRRYLRSPFQVVECVTQVIDSNPSLRLKGRRVPNQDVNVSRVVTDRSAFRAINRQRLGLPSGSFGRKKFVEMVKRGRPSDYALGTLLSRRGFWWVTPTQDLEEAKTQARQEHSTLRDVALSDKVLQVLQDRLGLIRFSKGPWMEIQYASNLFKGPLRVPTVLDAGDDASFRPWTEKDAVGKPLPTGWGKTVDAETCGDGLPEAIHGLDSVTGNVRINFIGTQADARVRPDNFYERLFHESSRTA